MHQVHQPHRQHEGHERGVEGEAERLDHRADVALDRLFGEGEGEADAAHRADEADGRDGPRDVPHEGEGRIEPVGRELRALLHGVGGVLHRVGGVEPVQRGEDALGQEAAPPARLAFHAGLEFPVAVERVLGQNAFPGLERHEVVPEQAALASQLHQLVAEEEGAPEGEDDLDLLFGVLDDDVEGALFRVHGGRPPAGRHHPLLQFDLRHARADDGGVVGLHEGDGEQQAEDGDQEVRGENPLVSGGHGSKRVPGRTSGWSPRL